MKIDLHNHTYLCNHASGSVDEYIRAAIACKTEVFGFSDHNPMNYDQAYRMSFDQMEIYEKMVLDTGEKFADKIKILLGYEVDFLEGFMDERVFKRKVDYLIGSVHFISGWGFDNPEFIGEYKNKDIDKIWTDYFECIINLAKCGKFDIVGHFDLIKIFKFLPKTDIRILALPALKAIKSANLAIEINSAGFRKPIGEQYPSHTLLEQIYELDIPISFGSDAHAVDQVGANGDICESLAREIGYDSCICFEKRDRYFVKF
ncbi:histidinol-phosphatase [Campylobacter sp. faydin G-105]|uniref:histidinol-phosphatase n=1 Tax=Campylobacter anatolicus TaxID=2829105 RepID=UPI001B96DA05|nr:histidinol-phosphatase [Campylobacter anatolicus]MBR8462080.1 histidinol-phosphatase [Campylobacter anatolicus]